MPYIASEMSLTNYKDRFIFVSGGECKTGVSSHGTYWTGLRTGVFKNVVKYDVLNDTWSAAPEMNQGRRLHNSITVGNNIYVFFGYSQGHD